MSIAVVFGTNLKNCRKAKGLTQAQLAEKVSLSTEMISKIERGVASPSFNNIERLSQILEVSESYLFGNGISAIDNSDRSQIIMKIYSKLSRLNNDQLARVDKVLNALID